MLGGVMAGTSDAKIEYAVLVYGLSADMRSAVADVRAAPGRDHL